MPKNLISAPISEDRILQLTNDLAEGMATGTVREWRAVANYWRDQFGKEVTQKAVVANKLLGVVSELIHK